MESEGQAAFYLGDTVPTRAHIPLPYVMAYVELDEGVRMLTNIVDCKPEDVKIGMPVEVTFEDATPEISIPLFKPAGK